MIDTKKLIKRLKTQLAVADHLQSDWVYITKNEAKRCLELAEAEDTILEALADTKNSNSVMEKSTNINNRKD